MALILEMNLFNTIQYGSYTAQSSNSFGTNDLSDTLTALLKIPFSQEGGAYTTVNVSSGYNTYYKMQGFNPLTQQYEDWHSMGAPLLIPPSGHTLENVSIIGSWIDR